MYNILICDDERDIVSALKIYLKDDNYRLFEAANGKEALEVIGKHDIHLALLDIMMPVMDGIETMVKLREQSNLPVILLTAKGEDADKVLGLNLGADDYITKPFNPAEVQARVKSQLRRLPLIWKTLLGFVLFALLSLMAVIPDYIGVRMGAWMIGLCLLFAAVVYTALVMRRLQIAVRKLARGDLSCRVDTRRMIGDFKEHGENLNSIGFGMTRAVDERMKSERLKTELITNVSHDIKTPLTSIINYVDLISKEDTDNEKIKEYTDVLSRQSERLKKLIEDLVEASKASTGNVDVSLAPCDVSVLISQSVGEYGEKLENAQLELLISKPEQPLMIMADGRLLWRVFDNLMNNVCKYAMPGTRVYMTLELSGGEAVVSIKNISKYPLNIKAEELMERFVRGDSSRSTEGSGLGLSIAGSLTSLMGGKFSVEVDGDLFKATLRFKKID